MTDRSIFIHAMWRTGSTWVWNKFREAEGYRAYYEPLIESLWRQRRSDFERERIEESTRALRHPMQERHYFDEFPFAEDGSVPLAREEMTFDWYCIDRSEEIPPLAAYLANLVNYAREHGEVPVFQFNRSLFRSGWMAARFPSFNIFLYRDAADTWKSFKLSEYFSAGLCRIVGRHRRQPYLRAIAERWSVPYVEGSWDEQDRFYRAFSREHGERLYPMFFAVSVVSLLENLPHTDLVMDLNAITESAQARSQVHARLRQAGIGIHLDDCRIPRYEEDAQTAEWRRREEEAVLEYLRLACGPRRKQLQPAFERSVGVLSAGARDLLQRALGE